MSAFSSFKKHTVEAQAVETKPGAWKEHLNKTNYRLSGILKTGAFASAAIAVGAFVPPVNIAVAGIAALSGAIMAAVQVSEITKAKGMATSTAAYDETIKAGGTKAEAAQAREKGWEKEETFAKRTGRFVKQVIKPF